MTAQYEVRGNVAVITLDNPPVNGLGLSTRLGITRGMAKALEDPGVTAIVLTGAGRAFSGGADIKEFGSPKALQEPNLLDVIAVVEQSTKPVIAAEHHGTDETEVIRSATRPARWGAGARGAIRSRSPCGSRPGATHLSRIGAQGQRCPSVTVRVRPTVVALGHHLHVRVQPVLGRVDAGHPGGQVDVQDADG